MAREMTPAEKRLWFEVLSGKKTGYKFIKQYVVHNYILDFYCSALLLAVEVDGHSHDDRQEYDAKRDQYLSACGIKTIRYRNDEVLLHINGVWEDLRRRMRERKDTPLPPT